MGTVIAANRTETIRRGKQLERITVAWTLLEAAVSIALGMGAGSVALLGFGVDSGIEVISGAALLWRLHKDSSSNDSERAEKIALRIVGWCFVALAIYITYDSITTIVGNETPKPTVAGIIFAVLSVVVMGLLTQSKRSVARDMKSDAMLADAQQNAICAYLGVALLIGLLLNAVFGLWWADPVAGLVMVPIIAKEGFRALQGKSCEGTGCH